MASLAVTAATLSWTLGAWLQERGARSLSSRFLVRTGLLVVVVGIAVMAVSLLHAVPVAISVVAWAIGGLGIGLAYAPITVTVLGLAPAAEQGTASAQLQLSDTLGTALGAGLGGVLVAAVTEEPGASAAGARRSGRAGRGAPGAPGGPGSRRPRRGA